MIKKLKISGIREDEYKIYIDDQCYTPQKLEQWSNIFHKVESVEEFSKVLAERIMREGTGNFFEGFGVVKTLHSNGIEMTQIYMGKIVQEHQYAPGLLIQIVDEDDTYNFQVEEMK